MGSPLVLGVFWFVHGQVGPALLPNTIKVDLGHACSPQRALSGIFHLCPPFSPRRPGTGMGRCCRMLRSHGSCLYLCLGLQLCGQNPQGGSFLALEQWLAMGATTVFGVVAVVRSCQLHVSAVM